MVETSSRLSECIGGFGWLEGSTTLSVRILADPEQIHGAAVRPLLQLVPGKFRFDTKCGNSILHQHQCWCLGPGGPHTHALSNRHMGSCSRRYKSSTVRAALGPKDACYAPSRARVGKTLFSSSHLPWALRLSFQQTLPSQACVARQGPMPSAACTLRLLECLC